MAYCIKPAASTLSLADLSVVADDLISFASSPKTSQVSEEFAPRLSPSPAPTPARKSTIDTGGSTHRMVSSDSFAALTGLVRSKQPWAPVYIPPPGLEGSNSQASGTRLAHSTEPSASQCKQAFPKHLGYDCFSSVAQSSPHCHDEPSTQPRQTVGSTVTVTSDYDVTKLQYLEDLITQMKSYDNLEGSGEASWDHDDQNMVSNENSVISCMTSQVNDRGGRGATPTFDARERCAEDVFEGQDIPRSPSLLSDLSVSGQAVVEVDGCQLDGSTNKSLPASLSYHVSEAVQSNGASVWTRQHKTVAHVEIQKGKAVSTARIAQLQQEVKKLADQDQFIREQLGKLEYELEVNKKHKAAMGREIRQKDVELCNKDMEISVLRDQLADAESTRKKLEVMSAELTLLLSNKTAEEEAQVRATQTIIAGKDQDIADLTALAARNQSISADHAIRAQNNVEALAKQQKVVEDYKMKFLEEQNTANKIRDQLEELRKSIPARDEAEALQKQLREKISLCDQQRNKTKLMESRLQLAQQSLGKVQEGSHLRGAAHLVIPLANAKLPKHVLPCMECFVNNMDCDNNARCENCTVRGEVCPRWRCSLKHALHECKEAPCRFVHDNSGWLMTKYARPQW